MGPAGSDSVSDWILAAVPDGLWVFDEDGRTTYANARLAELLGRTPDEMVGFSAFDAHDELGRTHLALHLARLRDGQESPEDEECLLVRADGSTFWAQISPTPLMDGAGQRRGWLHRVRDHTAQRRTVDELGRREEQLAEAQTIARIGSWEGSMDVDRLEWSDELYRVFEVDRETYQPTRAGFYELLHPDDREAARSAVAEMVDSGDTLDFDARLDRPPGHAARWVRTRVRAVGRDAAGEVTRIRGTVQDITEGKESEQGLAFLSAMAGAANEAQTLTEALLASDRVVRPFTQWPAVAVSAPDPDDPSRLIHFPTRWSTFTDGELAAAQLVAEQVSVERQVVIVPGPEGTHLVGGPVQVGDRIACIVVSDSRSVDAPRSSELTIFRQMLTLLANVAEREEAGVELAAARDAALEASHAKSEFLATMSHEIRTPLNGVIGLSELLSRTELNAHQRRLARGVDEAGRSLLALVNDILDISKIEAGRLDLEEVDFDPRAVLEQSVGLVAERASAKGLELVISSADRMPRLLCGDPVRFGQVITNLVANAVKFTQTGEIVVRARGEGSDGQTVRVEVRDTGIGISPESQDRVFSAFSQADSSTTREYGGTGLGLAISKRIVEALHGEIGVESDFGTGSTFWFTASFAPATAESSPSEAALLAAVNGLRVLVVDDNATNRFILGEQLEAWAVDFTAVESAYDALVELDASVRHRTPYDVALLDYMMPGADGEQLARIIRAEQRHAGTRLALLSSAIEPSKEWLREAGLDIFVSKPVLPSRLLEVVAALGGRDGGLSIAVPEVARSVDDVRRGRLLVVEDNPINQLVAEGVLRRLGYELVMADNGAAGVAALADDPEGFDAILMDCQMPVMDGFDATRAIRAMRGDGARIPIIAMTAAAIAEERERCLDAGMDDFLSKPVAAELLATTLARWVPDAATDLATLERPDVQDAVTAQSRLHDLVHQEGIDPALVLRMVDRFPASAHHLVDALRGAARAGDSEGAVRAAHSLRGSSANLGLVELAETCTTLENDARLGGLPTAGALDALSELVTAAADELVAAAAVL